MSKFIAFLRDDKGAVSVEYALIAVVVSIAIFNTLQLVAPSLNIIFGKVSTVLSTATAK